MSLITEIPRVLQSIQPTLTNMDAVKLEVAGSHLTLRVPFGAWVNPAYDASVGFLSSLFQMPANILVACEVDENGGLFDVLTVSNTQLVVDASEHQQTCTAIRRSLGVIMSTTSPASLVVNKVSPQPNSLGTNEISVSFPVNLNLRSVIDTVCNPAPLAHVKQVVIEQVAARITFKEV